MAIVQKSSTGAGTNVIAGLATGMISTFPTVLLFAAAIGLLRLQDFME
jgi:K(+)-stimulated pyrophosphate-energized sodium pump